MENPLRPVVVFHGNSEFEAQIARDALTAAEIPVLHLPSVSTGIFAVFTQGRNGRLERLHLGARDKSEACPSPDAGEPLALPGPTWPPEAPAFLTT